ncbi:MAG: hypothetical protein HC848_03085, partial [Limnobacter sp.]|nr:hypothetical protein [Limnobacter sp.]
MRLIQLFYYLRQAVDKSNQALTAFCDSDLGTVDYSQPLNLCRETLKDFMALEQHVKAISSNKARQDYRTLAKTVHMNFIQLLDSSVTEKLIIHCFYNAYVIVKPRLIVNYFSKQFRLFFLPFFQGVNRTKMPEIALWNAVVID